ncbi:S41 family peptidase [Flavihumibacter fluvii]|uniref:S41 family peptidase n=1 Tax=Flavihumibacter fluvii TaxID=2838157 RepID=UPI001EFBE3C7|nr:S41 family peptidase [Flavihumibacter fluvii]ULQ53342.1 S41 family peptidase [Flavihumibacter fluvii]
MDKNGKDLQQKTFSKGWDLQTPYIYSNTIVYQKGADIWRFDISSNKESLLDISLQSDFDQRKPRWIKSPVNAITEADLSPNGNYASIISRGRLFVSPAKSDRWIEISRKSGIRFKAAHFINDRSMAVLSDESGEYELWKVNADGSDSSRQITRNSKTIITSYIVSPNEKFIAYTDKNDVLRIIDINNGATLFRYDSAYSGLFDLGWSTDSRFLNFTHGLANLATQVCIVDMATKKMRPITTDRLNSYNPAWSADSSWLYFISERNLKTKVGSPWGSRQPEPLYTETANIFALRLDTAAKFPFLATDSWLSDSLYNPAPKNPDEPRGKKNKKTPPPTAKTIDWTTASQSVFQVPTKSGNFNSLSIGDGFLYWLDRDELSDEFGAKLFALKIEESKKYEPIEIADKVMGYTLSGNHKKLLIFYTNKNIAIADANGQKPDADKSKLQLDNWNFVVNPQQDWKQMFVDAWLMERDYFYDRDLHKVDWLAIRKQYEPLVERITDRYELDDLLAQMVGELSALHTFVYGGEKRTSPDRIPIGLLGAQLKKTSRGLLIQHIYKSDPDFPAESSPLAKPHLHIREGDIITAVNNVSLAGSTDIAELLANKVHIPVKLSLLNSNNQPFEQVVNPCAAYEDYRLRYNEWELSNRWKVDTASNNEIGYLHLKAMSGDNMDEFVKQFYPVFTRKGLIIDVRHNFGGNIDAWVLEKLMRKAWMYWQGRTGGPSWNMHYAFRGHMVILVDQVTSSDGEAVAEGFRRLGLGKVIGMRTWGGEIWLSSSNRLVDNGIATAAEFGVYGPEGKWLIEGHGVEPDIVVDNLPFETYKGKDAQLEFALDYLQKKIKAEPVDVPKAPPHPDKSFKY